MGKPRPKRTYSPELLEDLRYRFEQTSEAVRAIAAGVPMGRTTLYQLAAERGWTRYVPPPLDLTPAARLAAEAGRLNLKPHPEAPSRSDGLEGSVSQRPFEARPRRAPQGDGETPPPPTPDPSPPLEEPTGGGEHNAAAPSVTEAAESDADFSDLSREARRARLNSMARAIDHQLALLRQRQALPQTEHERKEISIEATKLNAALSQTEHDLQDLDGGHNVNSAIDDDGFPVDIDEAREELARRIDALVDEWLHEADADGASDVADEAGA